jgi:integrative and conjugative element protein (TIGR02256 family)
MIKKVVIKSKAKETLIAETHRFKRLETGGVLCGYYDNEYLIIDSVSGPGPDADHQIDEFIMDKEYMDKFLDSQYAESKGKNIYLGEWHTHPQKHPEPSGQDLKSIAERTMEWANGSIVFLIIGFVGLQDKNLPNQIIAIFFDERKQSYWQVPIEFEQSQEINL